MARSRTRPARATLTDVADRAGVSRTTASFVLSGRTEMRISMPTADRVREAARVLGYNVPTARHAAPAATGAAIAFVSDSIATDPFTGPMLRGAIEGARAQGHRIVVVEGHGSRGDEQAQLQDLIEIGVDLFVYATTSSGNALRLPAVLGDREVVMLNCSERRSHRLAVLPDEESAGALAARAVLDAGHAERIWLVGEVARDTWAAGRRMSGIERVLHDADLRLAEHVTCAWWPPDSREALLVALARGEAPSAVIALNDRVALGVYQAASRVGLRVPEDLSVVSFDNSDLAWWLDPGLSSIGLPYLEMGRLAVSLLLGDGEDDSGVHLVPMPLHARGSVATPAVTRATAR